MTIQQDHSGKMYYNSSVMYQVVQVHVKNEDVVFHDPMIYNAAYSLKCRLEANEKKHPNGWVYYIEKEQL